MIYGDQRPDAIRVSILAGLSAEPVYLYRLYVNDG